MGFDVQAEGAALAAVVAKQAAQYKPAPRKFASLTECFGLLYAVATDGTAWACKEGAWIQLDNLPAVSA
jgi:hypothetical protein